MSRKAIIIALILLGLVLGGFLIARSTISRAKAGILIETEPTATVFLDGEQVGTTPFKMQRSPGEVTVKLIPFAQDTPLVPYDTEVVLVSGIETVIKRSFGPTEEKSSGEVLFFERTGSKKASIAIVSSPEAAEVTLDGKSVGFTPAKLNEVESGQHTLRLSVDDYNSREAVIRTVDNYQLTAIIKLAKSDVSQAQKEEEPIQEGVKKQLVEILDTPTGFLRVRSEPSTAATESARVTPGKRYVFLEENTDKSWYKIEYEKSKTGWIAAQYAKKVEE